MCPRRASGDNSVGETLLVVVIISRQQRRMQVMRIRQRDDRYRIKKKKKQPLHVSSSLQNHQAKQLHQEPAYRRKPNPIRRYDTDVLSPVRELIRWKLGLQLLDR